MPDPITTPSLISDRVAHAASEISALVDDALNAADTRRAVQRVAYDPQAQQRWSRYCLIRDVMQGHVPTTVDVHFAERLQQAIAQEPPLRVSYRPWHRLSPTPLMRWSMAASVLLTGYLLLQHQQPATPTDPPPTLSLHTPAAPPPSPHAITPARSVPITSTPVAAVTYDRMPDPYIEAHLNSYLVNHSGRTSANNLQGMLPYVRLVGYQTDFER